MKLNEVLEALRALGCEPRLEVYRLLMRRGPEGYTPTDLTRRLDVPAPTLSFHLGALVRAGLVTSRREGRRLYYSPNIERMHALVGFLTENCCILADQARGTDCRPLAAQPPQRRRAS